MKRIITVLIILMTLQSQAQTEFQLEKLAIGNMPLSSLPPFAKVWIEGEGNPQIFFNSPSNPANERLWVISTINNEFRIMTENDNYSAVKMAMIMKRTNNIDIDYVSFPEGNFGIGTTSPSEKLDVNGNIKGKKGYFEAENASAVAAVTDHLDWAKYSAALSIGKPVKTNPNGYVEHRFNFTDFYATNAGLPSGSAFNIKTTDGNDRLTFSAWDNADTRFYISNSEGKEIFKTGNLLSNHPDNPTENEINFVHLLQPKSRIAIGTWAMYKPQHELTVRGSGWFEQEIVTKSSLAVGLEAEDIPSGYKLAVNGKAIATEIKVQTYSNWPDFVFDKEYDLANLEKVEKFINTNGHLPNIPSAQEVKENEGIELGEMNAKLLQKIEELTLYTIEQEKRLKINEEKNTDLEYRLEKLGNLVEQLINDKNNQ